MSFIRFWMGFTVVGIAVTVTVLYWALKAKQFGEPDRAAHMPLGGVDEEAIPEARASKEAIVLVGLFGIGIASLVVTTVLSFVW